MAEFKVQLLNREEETMNEAKPFKIEKRLVYEAYKRVKSNKGSAGIDGVDMEKFEENLCAKRESLASAQLFSFSNQCCRLHQMTPHLP